MDDVLDDFPSSSLDPGTHLLGTSPPMLDLRPLVDKYVARGLEANEGCIVVTTDQDARSAVASIDDHTTATELDRLCIVDATGQEPDEEGFPCPLVPVGSPADLTGIGIGISKHLEFLYASNAAGYRVLLDSVSSLLVYAGFERVFQFLHTVTHQIDEVGGTSVSLLTASPDQAQVAKFENLFDGIIELREGDERTEYRLRGYGDSTDWRSLTPGGQWGDASESSLGEPTEHDRSRRQGVPARALESPASLREIIDTVEATGQTLTLCNAGDGVGETFRNYFDRLNVKVRTATLSTDTPANVALLHRGSDVFAVSPIGELDAAIRVNTLDTEEEQSSIEAPEILNVVHRDEYAVENGTKLEMVRISRLIEARALGTGRGALHTGFQRVNRIDDERHTRDVYERIARAGVATHLYGHPGHVPNEELYSLHTAEDGELVDAWFVVFDGGEQDVRKGALVCEETGPGRYTGFWTYQPDVVDATLSYLEATYGAA